MKTSNLILICVVLIIAIAGVAAYFVWDSSQLDTHFVISKTNISTSDYFNVILMDENNESLVNKTVILTVTDSDNKSVNYSITTDDKGVATLSKKLSKGPYSVSGSFEGGDGFKSSSFDDVNLTVYKKTVATTTSSSSSGSSNNGWVYEGDGAYHKNSGEVQYVAIKSGSAPDNTGEGFHIIGWRYMNEDGVYNTYMGE